MTRFPSLSSLAGFVWLLAGAAAANGLAESDADRIWLHRNLGAAYFDNDTFEEAQRELALAAELAPDRPEDAHNAGVAALLAGDLPAARGALERARELAPEDPAGAYALGIVAKREGDVPGATALLLECRELGGEGPELAYNLGILAVRAKDNETALTEFAGIVDAGPANAPRHYPSALYRSGRTLLQSGQREEGAAALRRYQELVKSGQGAELSEEDLEVGALLELARLPRPADVRAAGPLPAFALSALPVTGEIRWADAADLDGDGDPDLLVGNGQTLSDLRRDGESWVDVTASRGLAGLLGVTHARALDLDNDGRRDLVRAGGGGIHFHPGIEGAWDPPLRITGNPVTAFAPVDFDHEGDVDLVAVGASGVALLQNNGDRSFTDITGASGLDGVGAAVAVVPGDFDDDLDVDLAFVTRKGGVIIASSLRGGRFEVQSPSLAAAPSGVFDLAAADLNGDGRLDLATAASTGIFTLRNDGDLSFSAPSAQPALGTAARWPTAGSRSLWIRDLDCDGRLDLIAARDAGAVLGLNAGDFSFLDSPATVRPLAEAGAHPVAVLLTDADGRPDLLTSRPDHGLARNIGGTGQWIVLDPLGVKNNRDGVGAVVELLAGSRYVRGDGDGRPFAFGLGTDGRVDAVRIRWPNGIHQGITDAAPNTVIQVEEKAGLVGSCPFLYTWNGERHEYVTDILTVTPLGLPIAPGRYVPPNWDEVIRVESAQLQPDSSGFLTVQVTEELREVTYLDQVRLYAIDHPAGTEVQPNEKFKFPPFPEFGVHVLDGARPPVQARDHRGRDVTEKLLFVDDAVVGDLPLTAYQGITEPHSLTLDFGPVSPGEPLMLHLAGWFYWTNASINLAVAQDPRVDFVPPQLEVRAPDGSWRPWPTEVGFPGGKTKSIPVDLTGAFPGGHAEIRLTTTLRLYWDRALLQVGKPDAEPRVTELLPDSADLHYRGHSAPIFSVTGEEPERFDYEVMREDDVPWNQHPGLYTRYGDVTPLVQEPEDMYVIMASGDECTVRWQADRLPELEPDRIRTYFLAFDGWAKDGDPNTALADQVEPLPFHAMSGYPYGPAETFPDDAEHRAYRDEWNTREGVRLVRDLAELAGGE
ncbi:MAG TPA: FG-GAP-like repeat-containing protein [bacterium]|nr:FG-GAP-like repeat-containing protein [bacterium]